MESGWSCWVLLLLLLAPACSGGPGPVLINRPFVTIWNIPTESCAKKYNVPFNLEVFDVLANDHQSFIGQDITLFYSKELGLLPYYTADGVPVNGGVPQNASLQAHLDQATRDIEVTLPSPAYSGLAVIDWEKWRPLWIRNWDSMAIYQQKSEELVQQQHPQWPPKLVKERAKKQFQQSAHNFMQQTLQLGETLRPDGYWGFYGFPNCYNNDFDSLPYTGTCPEVEQQRNEMLSWLWQSSRALYPSIYLPPSFNGTNKALVYVRHRVAEAFAVQRRVLKDGIPVLPYSQIAFDHTVDFLSQEDLMNTIGESAAQGAAGIILWGSLNYSKKKRWREMCLRLKDYVEGPLGHYIVNVTASADLCSQSLCSGQGRCVRREKKQGFLHLDPFRFAINLQVGKPWLVAQSLESGDDISQLAKEFSCQCYNKWQGPRCDTQGFAE
ncbi:PREDICTED: hyaluronidase-1 [Leptosomus discolor]|uniref:hyaluronidase-1 n=1 Tax=Leptosomus discolor TaxID=188344 RepID=UPI000522C883|nr:PREDICTED: hyaluronidase-1 [Leptosomus discolor]